MGIIKLNKKGENKGTQQNNAAEKKENKKLAKASEEIAVDNSANEIELCELAKQDAGFVEELENLRTANETVYRRNDRTCRKIITAKPTRYLDENGKYRDISNRLSDNGNEIENEANSFKVKFNKDATNGKIFDLQKGKKVVSLSAINSGKTRSHSCGCKCELCSDKEDTVLATLEDGTEIEYVTLTDRIKENIIINEKRNNYEYNFTLNIGDLAVEEGDNNSLLLKDAQTGEVQFTIPAPYMYDSNKVRSNDVSYEIDVNGEELQIKVIASVDFINAEERVLPVIIDPQIVIYEKEALSYYSEYYSPYNSENDISEGMMDIYDDGTSSEDIYCEINKNLINIEGVIEKVELIIVAKPNCVGYFKFAGATEKTIYPFEEKTYFLDITEKYINSGWKLEFVLSGDTNTYKNGTSQGSFYTSGENAPKIRITYFEHRDDYGQNKQPNIKQLEFGDTAKAHLYLNSGDVATEISDLTIGKNLPITVSHIHRLGKIENGAGSDWGINITNKALKKCKYDVAQGSKYMYTDELGDFYSFYEKYYYYENNEKVFINKDEVTIGADGELYYSGRKVFVHQTLSDGSIIAKVEDYIDSELIEQRQNEHIQLEETVKSYENKLCELVLVTTGNGSNQGEIIRRISGLDKIDFELLLNRAESSTLYLVMTESEALQLQSYYNNLRRYQDNISEIINKLFDADESDKDELNKEYNLLSDKKNELQNQTDYYIRMLRENQVTIKNNIKNYLIKKIQLTNYLKNLPENYLRSKDGIISGYNSFGQLVCVFDSYGNTMQIEYDINGRISAIYEGEELAASFVYEGELLQYLTDSCGRKIAYGYDKNSQLTQIIYANGEVTEIEYSSKRIRSIKSQGMQYKTSIDNLKRVTGIEQNSQPLMISENTTRETESYNKKLSAIKVEYVTDEDGRAYTQITDKEENTEKYVFDEDGRINIYESEDNKFVETVKTYTYDGEGNVIKIVTENNLMGKEEEIMSYDELNRLLSVEIGWAEISNTVKRKVKTQYSYDLNGKVERKTVTEIAEKNGSETSVVKITNYSYNAQGLLKLTESYVSGEELSSGKNYKRNDYDENGNIIRVVSWNSLDSSSKFYEECDRNEKGKVIAEHDETGNISAEYSYTDVGEANCVKYANGSVLAYGREANGEKITSVTQSTAEGEANTTDIVYSYGLPVMVKSGNAKINYTYDHSRRKTAVSVNGVTQVSYYYNQKFSFNGENEEAKYGDMSETIFVDGNGISFITNKYGTIDEETGAIKVTEEIAMRNNTDNTKTVIYKSAEDGYGRLSRVENGEKISIYDYDDYDNLMQVSSTDFTENYSYNEYGKLTGKIISNAVAHTYSYAYKNNAARDLDYVGFGNYKFYPLSDVNGRNTGKEIYNGADKIAAEYITYRKVGDHATNMPATVWFGGGNAIKDSIKYKYDSCSNISQITENGHLTAKYTYDSLNRLIREDNKALNRTVLYTYDNNGNIVERCEYDYTSKTGEELSTLACKHYSYDYDGDKLVSYNGESFVYSNLGNPTIYRSKIVTWQYGKYLLSYNRTSFTYDSLGRRATKGGITFTYDNENNLIMQSNGLEFIYDNRGVAGVIYQGESYIYRKDAQGNIIDILDSNGAVVVKYVYDAWGNHDVFVLNKVNGVEFLQDINKKKDPAFAEEYIKFKLLGKLNPFRYRGYYYDIETGLYYLQTRYYDPEVGRFISQDSIEYADPETINGLNLYVYCGNNPVMNVDPTGEFFWLILASVLLFTPVGGTALQVATSVLSYAGMTVASVFDEKIRNDMNLIGWNPFNTDESLALKAEKVSFYKGVPVIKHSIPNATSASFGVIILNRNESRSSVVKHEWGHNVQFMCLGLKKYTFGVAIPSLVANLISRDTSNPIGDFLYKNYYSLPWERTAEYFGGAENDTYLAHSLVISLGYLGLLMFI